LPRNLRLWGIGRIGMAPQAIERSLGIDAFQPRPIVLRWSPELPVPIVLSGDDRWPNAAERTAPWSHLEDPRELLRLVLAELNELLDMPTQPVELVIGIGLVERTPRVGRLDLLGIESLRAGQDVAVLAEDLDEVP